MINTIRKSKVTRVIASYLAIQMIVQIAQPMQLWALTSGPSQPEFNSFTPIGTSDMVNLSSGNFNYNIPIMDVGGYPLNLAYDSGVTMDQEASWTGLGWNLNVGQINRQVRGIPDDFKGDVMQYENNMRDNKTVGVGFNYSVGYAGIEGLKTNDGIVIQYNNYEGITFKRTTGLGYQINDNVKIGVDMSLSVGEGATISPMVSLSGKSDMNKKGYVNNLGSTLGVSFNSRKGLESLSVSFDARVTEMDVWGTTDFLNPKMDEVGSNSGTNYISFNNNTFTPTKRTGINNKNFSFTGSFGVTIYGVDGQGQINGYGAFQKINEDDKNKYVPAFGYENTEKGEGVNGILDFNREKDRTFNKHTTVVPVSNYTHDIYAIQGQGIKGMFRPYRSQVSYVYDHRVIDEGIGGSLGVKLGVGWNFYAGGRLEVNPSFGETGKWVDGNKALGKFIEHKDDTNPMDYEPSYFKMVGERSVDQEEELFIKDLHGSAPIKLEISGSKFHRKTEAAYRVKEVNNGIIEHKLKKIDSPKLKRIKRDLRNQSIIKVTNEEAFKDPLINNRTESFVKEHHTAGIKILKPDGSTYVYGEAAYNTKKVEATFDISGNNDVNCADGTVNFTKRPGRDYSKFSDRYLNKITTPAYAHSYLLSSVLSADYEDVDENGPTPTDLGTYTLFEYEVADNDYKWRVPYDYTKAAYNEGLKSEEDDQKGNYIYGEKEIKYIKKIETKTHIAIFHLSNREDARGAKGEGPTAETEAPGYMKQLDSISLYSKPEYDLLKEQASPIKKAHFRYTYELCKGVPNNLSGGGKLTLSKLYFTYRNSNMGKYTPYVFNYDSFNPDYNLKSYDIWGNYKPVVDNKLSRIGGEIEYETTENGYEIPVLNSDFDENKTFCSVGEALLAPEFPYVQQEDKKLQDAYATAWTLTSIGLPSGGKLELEMESDDYQYVQKLRAMQMFKITGAADLNELNDIGIENHNILYDGGDHRKFIIAKLSNEELEITADDFKKDYIGDQIDEPIQFRVLMNMVNKSAEQYDYVSGYFEIDHEDYDFHILHRDSGTYAAIPLKSLKREGGFINSNKKVNPITKAGWYFGRTYLNRQVYSLDGNRTNDNFEEIIDEITGSIGAIFEIFTGPNGKLQEKRSSRRFQNSKSWVRLLNPNKRKLGGGARVKEIRMHDQWGTMVNNDSSNPVYAQFYGQQYTYTDVDGMSSGVATFEPNGSKENPLVKPFYDEKPNSDNFGKDKLAAPQAFNFTEEPLGESFFPASTVTYSRVEVKNLPRKRTTEDGKTYEVVKNATGKVVNEFFTTRDFPTIVNYTDITRANDQTSILYNILTLGVNDRNHLTMSQGFTIETNDMNGRMERQQVFPEGQESPISEVEYVYNVNEKGNLNNTLPVIDRNGKVNSDKSIGVHYDVINEFREHKSNVSIAGLNGNLTGFAVLIYPAIINIPLPSYSRHQDILRTATTTKVIHKSGILVEKIARDLQAEVSTKNVAWDAVTGEVLLTKTINEYDNHYYNFTYPAHWKYDGMGLASKNIGISGTLDSIPDAINFRVRNQKGTLVSPTEYFRTGDELMTQEIVSRGEGEKEKLWVIDVAPSGITLMNRLGYIVNQKCSEFTKTNMSFKIVRSGYRNQQMASMASVTSMINPIDIDNNGTLNDFLTTNYENYSNSNNPRIVNASAVSYTDYWKPQREHALPGFPKSLADLYDKIHREEVDEQGNEFTDQNEIVSHAYGFNPYLYNVRGDWRAIKSYAYLTGRNSNVNNSNFSTADNGFFTSFNSFYNNSNQGVWEKNDENWTFASQVTTYSPYGAELENKDALDRYSAAQYGYYYTLPIAVASNSQYQEMGYDGFEDYKLIPDSRDRRPHFDFNELRVNSGRDVDISNETSHTGKYSLKISGGIDSGEAMLIMSLEECDTEVADIVCSDPDPDPIICERERKEVTLHGRPFETINFRYIGWFDPTKPHCAEAYYIALNGGVWADEISDEKERRGTIQLNQSGELDVQLDIELSQQMSNAQYNNSFVTITFDANNRPDPNPGQTSVTLSLCNCKPQKIEN